MSSLEKLLPCSKDIGYSETEFDKGYDEGYNRAIDACLLALLKALGEGKIWMAVDEDKLTEFFQLIVPTVSENSTGEIVETQSPKLVAQAIIKLMRGER